MNNYKRIRNVCGTLGVVLMLAATTNAATWHVVGNGNDTGDGSEKAPFASLKRAIEAAIKAGDASEIVMHAGVYPGDTTIPAPTPATTNPPPWTVRAATKADGSYEEVVIDGGRKVTEAHALDAARGVYFLPFHLANFEPSMWEAETRIRYIFAADRRAVEAFPGSIAPGKEMVNGELKEGVVFRTSDGKPPSAHELGLARDRIGLVILRPNVTVKGLRFRNFQLHFGVGGVSIEAPNVTVDSCDAWNCYGLAGVGEGILDARIINCTARDVARGVKSYGKNTVVENCRFFRIDDAFVVQENEQDQCGIQFYTSHVQTARRNLCVGFNLGIFIKASGGVLILENNTVVASAKGGERGLGPNTWRAGSICRDNVVVGFEEAISTGEGLTNKPSISGNRVWYASNPKRPEEIVEKIKAATGGENVVATPRFVNERKEDYRLTPRSMGATIGAMGVAPAGEADKMPPTVRLEVLPPAQPLGLRSKTYFRKNTWIGGKEPELIEDTVLAPDQVVWMTPSNTVEMRLRAEDAFGKLKQLRYRIGDGKWSDAESFRETLKIELPKNAQAMRIAVQVSDEAGNWSEPSVVSVAMASRPPMLATQPAIATSGQGAIIAFQTDVPCVATLEWGANGKLDQRTDDGTETRFRFDNNMGLEWTQHITGPRTNHCLAVTAPVKEGETYSFRLKLGYGTGEPSLVHEGKFTVKGPARTLHVATTGKDDETSGVKDQPFATIQHAVDRALPGDRVLVAPGIYTGSVSVKHGGTAGHPIRIESAEPLGAVLDGRREADAAFRVNKVAHVQISGFEMRWYNNFGVIAYQTQDLLIEGCKFWDRHWVKGRPSSADGVVVFACKRVTLDRNLFFAVNSAFRILDSEGIRVTSNTAAKCFHRVASFAWTSQCYLRNNSFAFGSSYLLSLYLNEEQVRSFDSDYNNYAVHLREDSDGFKNAPPAERLTRENNDFYYGESKALAGLDGPGKTSVHAATINMPTLTAWREKTGQDRHSIAIHPRYVDPQNRDFRLLPNSPNIGAGEKGANIGALGIAAKAR